MQLESHSVTVLLSFRGIGVLIRVPWMNLITKARSFSQSSAVLKDWHHGRIFEGLDLILGCIEVIGHYITLTSNHMILYEHNSCSWKFSLLFRMSQAVQAGFCKASQVSLTISKHKSTWKIMEVSKILKNCKMEKIFHTTVLLWDFDKQYETC